ncbi:MAG: AI-2E family transporter [Clostridia bacterium]|nr:AI-2E family transporter [Clostridia bacterium]
MKIDAKTIAKIGLGVFLTYLCIYYWPAISGMLSAVLTALVPLIIGCSIAYIVNLVMSLYERIYFPKSQKKIVLKTRRLVCLLAAMISLVALIALIIIIVLPQLSSCISLLFTKIPEAFKDIVTEIEALAILPENVTDSLLKIDWNSIVNDFLGKITNGISSIVGTVVNVVSSVVGGFLTAFLSIMFSFYLLYSKEKLGSQAKCAAKKVLKPSVYNKLRYLIPLANKTFRGYIIGQCTEAAILGVLCGLGMWALGMPYAAMISALIAFTSLVPIAGPYIGGTIAAFMIFTVSPLQALIFIVFIIVLQQIEGNLIYPKVVGTSVGLPAIWVLVAITVGGGLMGILGMLLSVPVAAIIYRVLKDKFGDKPKEQE